MWVERVFRHELLELTQIKKVTFRKNFVSISEIRVAIDFQVRFSKFWKFGKSSTNSELGTENLSADRQALN